MQDRSKNFSSESLKNTALEALRAKTARHAKSLHFRDNLQGVAYSERISQSAHYRAGLLNLARSIDAGAPTSARLPLSEVTTLDELQRLGCVRVVIEDRGGHWVRLTTGAQGWGAWLQMWDGRGWVAWWERGEPMFPVAALRLGLEEIRICQ